MKFYQSLILLNIVNDNLEVQKNYNHLNIKTHIARRQYEQNEEVEIFFQTPVLEIDDTALNFLVNEITNSDLWKKNDELTAFVSGKSSFLEIKELRPLNEMSLKMQTRVKDSLDLGIPLKHYKYKLHQKELTQNINSTTGFDEEIPD
jgi:hypothetical protein